MKQLLEAQRLLERQRYSFPENWISMDTVQNSWTSMNDILKRKEHVIETKVRPTSLFLKLIQNLFFSSVGYNSRKS
jgi:dynein heavy chain 1